MSWDFVDDDCPLCEMDEQTQWYYEDCEVVIADAIGTGKPFVVYKAHQDTLTAADWEVVLDRVEQVFGEGVEVKVQMNKVEHHWHGHIRDSNNGAPSLANE